MAHHCHATDCTAEMRARSCVGTMYRPGRLAIAVSPDRGTAVKVEVRCCCQPTLLLGHVQVPDNLVLRDGLQQTFLLKTPTRALFSRQPSAQNVCIETVTLTIGRLLHRGQLRGLAFKSNDTPIKTLKRIDGFRAAPVPFPDGIAW